MVVIRTGDVERAILQAEDRGLDLSRRGQRQELSRMLQYELADQNKVDLIVAFVAEELTGGNQIYRSMIASGEIAINGWDAFYNNANARRRVEHKFQSEAP